MLEQVLPSEMLDWKFQSGISVTCEMSHRSAWNMKNCYFKKWSPQKKKIFFRFKDYLLASFPEGVIQCSLVAYIHYRMGTVLTNGSSKCINSLNNLTDLANQKKLVLFWTLDEFSPCSIDKMLLRTTKIITRRGWCNVSDSCNDLRADTANQTDIGKRSFFERKG